MSYYLDRVGVDAIQLLRKKAAANRLPAPERANREIPTYTSKPPRYLDDKALAGWDKGIPALVNPSITTPLLLSPEETKPFGYPQEFPAMPESVPGEPIKPEVAAAMALDAAIRGRPFILPPTFSKESIESNPPCVRQ